MAHRPYRWSGVRGWTLVTASLLAACGGNAGDIQSSKGVIVDSIAQLRTRQDLRVGSDQDADSGFTHIVAITVGPQRRVYVLEGQDRQVRVYGPTGGRVRTIGREGKGPGEFQSPSAIGFKGDTLWAVDLGSGRITLFDSAGVLLGTVRVPTARLRLPSPMVGNDNGTIPRVDGLLGSSPSIGSAYSPGNPGPDSVVMPDLVFDRSGNVVDTVGSWVLPGSSSRSLTIQGHSIYVPGPPSDLPLRIVTSTGFVTVERRRAQKPGLAVFTVVRAGLDGDTLYDRDFQYRPRRFAAGYLENLTARDARLPHRLYGLDSAAVQRALEGAIELPPFQTPISLVVVGDDGSVWLRREDDGGPTFHWLVLSPDGVPVGRIEVPRSVTILWTRVGLFYGFDVDDLGIPWLVRYQVGAGKATAEPH